VSRDKGLSHDIKMLMVWRQVGCGLQLMCGSW